MAKKRKRRIRKDRVAGAVLVLAAFVTGIVLLVNGCRRDNNIMEVTDMMVEAQKASSAPARPKQQPLPPAMDGMNIPVDSFPAVERKAREGRIRIISHGPLREVFNDSNHRQLEHAMRLGIEPVASISEAYNTRRPIVLVKSTHFYTVDSLTHSIPFLVPEAERLLSDIGKNFIDSLSARGAGGYRIIATSLLRTPGLVKRLRRVNVNATETSTHQFATTFDLSYRRFDCTDTTRYVHEEDLKNLLAEVLFDLRAAGRCLVKFERKTGCFHITTVK